MRRRRPRPPLLSRRWRLRSESLAPLPLVRDFCFRSIPFDTLLLDIAPLLLIDHRGKSNEQTDERRLTFSFSFKSWGAPAATWKAEKKNDGGGGRSDGCSLRRFLALVLRSVGASACEDYGLVTTRLRDGVFWTRFLRERKSSALIPPLQRGKNKGD